MARAVTNQRKAINTMFAWAIGLLIFFPIMWTILTSFKTEAQAINDPPIFFFFDWTMENYAAVLERSDYAKFLWNSIIIAVGSTILGIIIAVPAAWSMAFVPSKRTKDILVVDALHKNVASGWCALPYLSDIYSVRDTGQSNWFGCGIDADQSADHHLDAVHLL